MPEDLGTVQPVEPVLQPVEPVSLPAEPVKPAEPKVLTEELVRQIIAEATAKAVEQAGQLGRRKLQSEQDRNKAELAYAQRRARLAESTLGATRTHIQTLDPDIAKEVELAELRADKQGRQTMEQEEAQRQQQEAFARASQESLVSHLEELGIAPDDKRIDWAEDAPDYLQGRRRFDSSVAKIQRESVKALEAGIDAKIKEAEKRIRKELNIEDVNSVSTTTSSGVVVGSDADFVRKFAASEIPMTKTNVDRYNKILNM